MRGSSACSGWRRDGLRGRRELAPLRAYYDSQLQLYAADRAAARELVSVGVTPVDGQIDVAELAALSNVTAAVMNTPDAYMLR